MRIYLHTIALYLILRQQGLVQIWIKEILPKDYQVALPIQMVFHHTPCIYQLQAAPCPWRPPTLTPCVSIQVSWSLIISQPSQPIMDFWALYQTLWYGPLQFCRGRLFVCAYDFWAGIKSLHIPIIVHGTLWLQNWAPLAGELASVLGHILGFSHPDPQRS